MSASAHEDWARASAAHEDSIMGRYERMQDAAVAAHAEGDEDLAQRRLDAAREILRGDRGEWGLCGPDTHPEEIALRAPRVCVNTLNGIPDTKRNKSIPR
jgi:hypothetical protein